VVVIGLLPPNIFIIVPSDPLKVSFVVEVVLISGRGEKANARKLNSKTAVREIR
jgi:hypothetical protein